MTRVCVCVSDGELTLYHYGWKDCATVLFYLFITIILHAVVQEYILDVSYITATCTVGTVVVQPLVMCHLFVFVCLSCTESKQASSPFEEQEHEV